MEVGTQIQSLENLRQGDVIGLEWIPSVADGEPERYLTPRGVALISQTCDVVQESQTKLNVAVAPVVRDPDAGQVSDSKNGRAPLLLYLPRFGESPEAIVDMQRITSVPKSLLIGKPLVARHIGIQSSSAQARKLAARVGRVYSRFAFPDEVVPVLDKLKKKARRTAKGSGAFGRVLEHLDLRVQADHWDGPGRTLRLYVVVKSELMIMTVDADPEWSWESAGEVGIKEHERILSLDFTRLSEILADACASHQSEPGASNETTLLRLWERWAVLLREELLAPYLSDEVVAIEVELLNDEEIPIAEWRRTVSLDLEDLSKPNLPVADSDVSPNPSG